MPRDWIGESHCNHHSVLDDSSCRAPTVKQACDSLLDVFEVVRDEGEMLQQSFAAIWEASGYGSTGY